MSQADRQRPTLDTGFLAKAVAMAAFNFEQALPSGQR
jgi:hypothetical protein